MNFNDLDALLRMHEAKYDVSLNPNDFLIARLDGRGFTSFCKRQNFTKPFDLNFSNYMRITTEYLMKECEFNILYGYTQSDEISLLFNVKENNFNRKLRKLNSVLAGSASAIFTKEINEVSVFDCRTFGLSSKELVIDYFSWRQEDSIRNALNGSLFWSLVEKGYSARKATSASYKLNKVEKKEMLLSNGINFNSLDAWKKYGIGFYFIKEEVQGWNPVLQESIISLRKKLVVDTELTTRQIYRNSIKNLLGTFD
jgi:tRNA(His) guanylyltransferase